MTESLILYFNAFRSSTHEQDDRKLSYLELMGISWSLHLIQAFYSVFALFLGAKSYSYFSESKDFTHFALEAFNFKFQKISLISTLFAVIFYPFIFQFAYKFWKSLFAFYNNIFDSQIEQIDELGDEILTSAFSANLFLIIPIIGNVLSNVAMAFFLFQGFKRKYEFTSLQSFLILMTPLFLIFLISVFSASYFVFLFSLL
jgi:hypothetical protein